MRVKAKRLNKSNDTTVWDISMSKIEIDLLYKMSVQLLKKLPDHIELMPTKNRLRNFLRVMGEIVKNDTVSFDRGKLKSKYEKQ